MEVRRNIDREYLTRAEAFIRRSVAAGTPFYVYFNHSMLHLPTVPRDEFKGEAAPATGPTACWRWMPISAHCSTCSTN